MRIIKAAFSKTFPIQQYYEKIYLEAELNETDDARQVLYDLKKQVESFFFESTKAAEKQMGTQLNEAYGIDEGKPTLTKTAALIRDINSCQDLTVLGTYDFIIRQVYKNDEDVKVAYNRKQSELMGKFGQEVNNKNI